ncbi:MAG: PadR family transcriptional regulator, partial [Candidatus Methanomethylicaceae archaeon]
IYLDIVDDIMFKYSPSYRRWTRFMAKVPKGFLRYRLLEMLEERPMSGSEIMSAIEEKTNGHWRPSPGSIYPLLAWLKERGFARELPPNEEGLKRYELTEFGKNFLREQRIIKEKLEKEYKWSPSFLDIMWFRLPPEKCIKMRESIKDLFNAFLSLRSNLEKNFSDQSVEELIEILNNTTKKLEELKNKLGT